MRDFAKPLENNDLKSKKVSRKLLIMVLTQRME